MPFNLDFKLVKKSGSLNKYTSSQIDDLIKCTFDPIYFCENFIYVKHPVKARQLFTPYSYQREFLHALQKHRFVTSLLPRQSGKCCTYNTLITIRNKKTGEVKKIAIGDFYNIIKRKNTIG